MPWQNAFTFVNETEQDVLSANEAVVEEARLFLGEHQDSSSTVRKTFEHVLPPSLLRRSIPGGCGLQPSRIPDT